MSSDDSQDGGEPQQNIKDEGIVDAAVPSSVDLPTQIEQNNIDDMEARIKNAMAGMATGANPTQSAVQQLESLFPSSNGGNGNSFSSKTSAGGGTTGATSSVSTYGNGAPVSSAQDLSLLSLFNNFLPSSLAMAMNDPNFLLPTPFAPGQNVPNGVSSLFGAATGGANGANALQLPQYMLQQQTQQALLQQLGLGGAASASTMPSAASPYGFPSTIPMNPADINFLLAASAATGYPGGAAAAAASLNPHLAAAAMMNPTGMVAGLSAQFGGGYPNMFNPSTAAAAAMNPMAQYAAMVSMPQQTVTMDQSVTKMLPSHRGTVNGVTGIGPDSEPMIKSREARWIIRYNELLQFRVDNGHCRVPHGYTANRKLSWWVMNQRAQWSHRNQGRKCWLTNERIKMLNDIGFIWTPHMKRKGDGSSNNDNKKKKDCDETIMPESLSSENGGEHIENEIDCEDDFDGDKEKKSKKIKSS